MRLDSDGVGRAGVGAQAAHGDGLPRVSARMCCWLTLYNRAWRKLIKLLSDTATIWPVQALMEGSHSPIPGCCYRICEMSEQSTCHARLDVGIYKNRHWKVKLPIVSLIIARSHQRQTL